MKKREKDRASREAQKNPPCPFLTLHLYIKSCKKISGNSTNLIYNEVEKECTSQNKVYVETV